MPNKKNNRSVLRIWQIGLFLGFLAFWHVATSPTLLPPLYFDNPHKAAFFFGEGLPEEERRLVRIVKIERRQQRRAGRYMPERKEAEKQPDLPDTQDRSIVFFVGHSS